LHSFFCLNCLWGYWSFLTLAFWIPWHFYHFSGHLWIWLLRSYELLSYCLAFLYWNLYIRVCAVALLKCLPWASLFFYFFFLHFYYHILVTQKGFMVIFPYMHIMYFDQIHPIITLSHSSPI
jgi:hypothetical protein